MSSRKKLCIVGEHPRFNMGGAEVQLAILADALIEKYDITYLRITDRGVVNGGETLTLENGIVVEQMDLTATSGLRSILVFLKKFRKIRADIYIQYSSGKVSGLLGLATRLHRKKMLFIASSDKDVDRTMTTGDWNKRSRLFKLSYKLGLRLAHAIVTKTSFMYNEMLKMANPKKVHLIRSCFSEDGEECDYMPEQEGYFLWVGRFRELKHPLVIPRIARQIREEMFVICGDGAMREQVVSAVEGLDNVVLTGGLRRSCVLRLIEGCRAIVSTSPQEGFPNVFMEAWSRGKPVISRVNPDGIVTDHSLGLLYETEEELVSIIENFDEMRSTLATPEEIKEFLTQTFGKDRYVEEYDSLFQKLF